MSASLCVFYYSFHHYIFSIMIPRILLGSQLVAQAMAASSLSLELESEPGSAASGVVGPSFAGFGIEPSQLFYFTGGEEPNDLSFNLINNLANYTGSPPHIRLGGNTQDYHIYDEDNTEWRIRSNPDSTGNGTIASDSRIIGPRFFEAMNRMPEGTPVTWGLNLAYDAPDYIDQITTMAEQVLSRCTNLNVTSFEIGNEPDLYGQNGFRKGSWSGSQYAEQWLERAAAIYEKVLKPNNLPSNMFEPGATAFTTSTSFEIEKLVDDGINEQANNSDNSYVYAWNQHNYYYFIDITKYPITLEDLMNWKTTESRIGSWSDQLTQAEDTSLPFVLREMAVVGPLGLEGISNTFASALWTLNFLLYAATLNISSVQFHMTADSNSSAWQPTEKYGRKPFVRPLYYGLAAFDETIGAGSSGATRISKNNMTDYPSGYDEDIIRSYSIFQDGTLASMAVINGKVANTSTSDKGSITIQATLPTEFAGKSIYLSHLTSDGADATKNTTWNGVSFEESGDGTPIDVSEDGETVKVGDDGSVSFTVRDSEAVIASIGSKLSGKGSSEADEESASTRLAPKCWHGLLVIMLTAVWGLI